MRPVRRDATPVYVQEEFVGLEQKYEAAIAAAENARSKDEEIAYLEEAFRVAQTIEWMRNAVPQH